jgi:hypothetical protein
VRLLKKFVLLATELVFLFFGIMFSIGFAAFVASAGSKFAFAALLLGFFLTSAPLVWFRRKAGQWTVVADAKAWLAQRSWRKLHPRRAKYLRILHRGTLWLPSLCSTLVLSFLPVASHVVYGGRQLVPHYRVDSPWNWLVIGSGQDGAGWEFSNQGAARYGFTPVWFNRRMPSGADFFWSAPQHAEGWWRPENELTSGHTTHIAVRKFQLGTITATCYEYRHIYNYGLGASSSIFAPDVLWESLCSTQPNGVDYNLRAAFLGYQEDLPAFYDLLNSARPAN